MRGDVGILLTPAFLHDCLHFVFVIPIEGDRSVDLLQAEGWVVRPDRFGVFAIAILPDDAVDRHTTSYQVEAGLTLFDEVPIQRQS